MSDHGVVGKTALDKFLMEKNSHVNAVTYTPPTPPHRSKYVQIQFCTLNIYILFGCLMLPASAAVE
jgi:hypothetical protein